MASASSIVFEVLLVLFTNSIVWLTLIGISIRALMLDFKEIEKGSKKLYKDFDNIDLDFLEVANKLTPKAFLFVFGLGHRRQFGSAILICAISFSGLSVKMWTDWKDKHPVIISEIGSVVFSTSPEWYNLCHSDKDYQIRKKSFRVKFYDTSSWAYVNSDIESKRVRALFKDFSDSYDQKLRKKKLMYYNRLNYLFGKIDYGKTRNSFPQRIVSEAIGAIILASIFDFLAILLTWEAYRGRKKNAYTFFIFFCALLLCFVCSVFFYIAYVARGMLIVWYIIFSLMLGISSWICGTVARQEQNFSSVLQVLFVFFLFLYVSKEAIKEIAAIFGNSVIEIPLQVCFLYGTSLYPFLLVFVIYSTLALAKVTLKLLKEFSLGHVLGVATVAGGTFFFGFLSLVVTSTAFVLFIIGLFN